MNRDDIIICAGNYLERHEYVEASNIQREIIYSSERKEIVSIEDIVDVLDFLVSAGFLEVYSGNDKATCKYTRFLPPIIKKALRKNVFVK